MRSCLIVADDPVLARQLEQALQPQFVVVDLACDAEEALTFTDRTRYSLILLNVPLRGIDGSALVGKLRQTGVLAHVIILSDRCEVADRVEGLRAGADDYLCKPFHLDELLARVYALLRRPVPHLTKLQVADLELDCTEQRVTRAGKRIHLGRKEFAILEYLMRNARHPVSRKQIIDACWDGGLEGSPSILDVYISYLRGKIDHGFQKKLIHTLRGVGYTITDSAPKKGSRSSC